MKRRPQGFILIHRAIEDTSCLRTTEELGAWVRILLMASFQDEMVTVSNFDIDLERGQFVGSIRYLSNRLGMGKKKVEVLLRRLIADGAISEVTQKGTQKVTRRVTQPRVLSVCNYDKYQRLSELEGTRKVTREVTQEETNLININKYNTPCSPPGDRPWIGEDQEQPAAQAAPAKSVARPMPEDYELTEEHLAYARKKGLSDEETEVLFQDFVDHWTGPGSKTKRADWSKTWMKNVQNVTTGAQTWKLEKIRKNLRNKPAYGVPVDRFGKPNYGGSRPPSVEEEQAMLERHYREIAMDLDRSIESLKIEIPPALLEDIKRYRKEFLDGQK